MCAAEASSRLLHSEEVTDRILILVIRPHPLLLAVHEDFPLLEARLVSDESHELGRRVVECELLAARSAT